MKIEGKFEILDVTNGEGVPIAVGRNTFTNVGKQHVCDWLSHDNISEDVDNGVTGFAGGRSISNEKIVPNTNISIHRTGSHSYTENPDRCMFPLNSDYSTYMKLYSYNSNPDSYNTDYGTAFFEFDTPVDLRGMMIWGHQTSSWDYTHTMVIETSPDDFATNDNWTRRKIWQMSENWQTDSTDTMQLFKFGYHNDPEKVIENVKTLKLMTVYDWNYSWGNYYGVWFTEANAYPTTPSVIGIGSGDTAPSETDTALVAESARKFIYKHRDAGADKIKYSVKLEREEANGVEFKEIGLFFNTDDNSFIGGPNGPDVCTGMMARGLFDTPWTKTSEQVIEVNYTLTING